MKRNSIFIILISILWSIGLSAQDSKKTETKTILRFEEMPWKKALQMAKESNQTIFVQVFTENCIACDKIKKDVWMNEDIAKILSSNFICWHPVQGSKDAKAFEKKYKIRAYPTTLFINGKGEVIDKYVGAVDARKMTNMAQNVKNGEFTLAFYRKLYNQDGREMEPEMLLNYAIALRNADEDYEKLIADYFKTQSEEEMLLPRNIRAIMIFVENMHSPEFTTFARQYRNVESKEYSEGDMAMKVEDVISNTLMTELMANPKLSLDDTLQSTIQYFDIIQPENLISRVKMDYYDYVKPDKEKYCEALSLYMHSHLSMLNVEDIMQKAEKVTEECNNPIIISDAIMWVNEAMIRMEQPGVEIQLAYIHLLTKDHRYDEAHDALNQLVESQLMEGGDEADLIKLQEKEARKIENARIQESSPDQEGQLKIER